MENNISKAVTFLGKSFFLLIVGLVVSAFVFFGYIFWGPITVTLILLIVSAVDIIFYSDTKKKDTVFYLIGMAILAIIMFLPVEKPFTVDVFIFYLGVLVYIYPFTTE